MAGLTIMPRRKVMIYLPTAPKTTYSTCFELLSYQVQLYKLNPFCQKDRTDVSESNKTIRTIRRYQNQKLQSFYLALLFGAKALSSWFQFSRKSDELPSLGINGSSDQAEIFLQILETNRVACFSHLFLAHSADF